MATSSVKISTRILVAVTFIAMIVVNALANILPINGQATGQVSDSYGNLFAPAGLTFAIWGLIYLLLAGFTFYQSGIISAFGKQANTALLEKVGSLFALSSLANAAWIFAWHYVQIGFSVVCMLVILVCLILINQTINKKQLTAIERVFVQLPFSVYFGWITVATIANVTTLLVSLGWNGLGLSEQTWTILILIVGILIAVVTTIRNHDLAYGLVILWAYAGILIKHTSIDGFAGKYTAIIATVIACMVILVLLEAFLVLSKGSRSVHGSK